MDIGWCWAPHVNLMYKTKFCNHGIHHQREMPTNQLLSANLFYAFFYWYKNKNPLIDLPEQLQIPNLNKYYYHYNHHLFFLTRTKLYFCKCNKTSNQPKTLPSFTLQITHLLFSFGLTNVNHLSNGIFKSTLIWDLLCLYYTWLKW